MAGAVKVLGLVKSARVVVVSVDAGERHQYRGLVLALPLPAETADRGSRQHGGQRGDAPSLRGIRLWLCIQIVPSARGCSADLPVRHLAVERHNRTVGGDRGRGLLRGAVGDCPRSAGHDDGSGHNLERRVGDCAVDPDRGMLLMVCGADQEIYFGNAIENSIWALAFFIVAVGLCRLLPEFDGAVRVALVVAIIGIAGYLAFLATIDIPMYLTRWRAEAANGSRPLSPLEGLRDASFRWVVTHDIAEWKDEIAWMSLYFSAAVWASLALCVCYCAHGAP